MTQVAPVKVLVTGTTNGKFEELFSGVQKINTKYGPFDLLLCVGDLFGETDSENLDSLLANEIEIPISTYFIHGDHELPETLKKRVEENNGEICTNLVYLGQHGKITTTQGVQIAFVSGRPDSSEIDLPMSVDIFLTHEWPKDVSLFSSRVPKYEGGSECIANLTMKVRPRYHFATAANEFYQREPYGNMSNPDENISNPETASADVDMISYATWFIGLAEVGNKEKSKWYYGFNIVPLAHLEKPIKPEMPANTTECPYSLSKGRKRLLLLESKQEENRPLKIPKIKHKGPLPKGYVCRICEEPGHWIHDCPNFPSRSKSSVPPLSYTCNKCLQKGHWIHECPSIKTQATQSVNKEEKPCWFCLSNPKASKHLIVSVGEVVYLAMARGGLIDTTSNILSPIVPGGGHVVLVSVDHYQNFYAAPLETQVGVFDELEKFKSGLKKLYQHYGANMVVLEYAVETGRHHAHMQVLPIPIKYTPNDIRKKFLEEAKRFNINLEEAVQAVKPPFSFRVELPDGTCLSHKSIKEERLDQHFGRKVLAKLLECTERWDWKACSVSEKQEREDRDRFEKAFLEYDFSKGNQSNTGDSC